MIERDAAVAGEDKQELVALRDRRDAVIDALSTHFTNDVLGLDEFERRVNLAHGAGSIAELDELLRHSPFPLPSCRPRL